MFMYNADNEGVITTKYLFCALFFIHSFVAPSNILDCDLVVKLHFLITRGDAKLLFSAANDGTIIAWGSGGAVHDRIPVS